MSFFRSLLLAILIVAAAVHFGGNYLVEQSFKNWLGVSVSVSNVRWGFASHHLIIKGLRIKNPPGYSSDPLAVIQKVQVDYDPSEISQGRLRVSLLEVMAESVRLEKKSTAELNVFALNPLMGLFEKKTALSQRQFPVHVEIEKARIHLDKVLFETKLGNDIVHESRSIGTNQDELLGLKNPDGVAVYMVLLALRGAGWQNLLPDKAAVLGTVEKEVSTWVEELKRKAEIFQAQIQQAIAEKLNPKS